MIVARKEHFDVRPERGDAMKTSVIEVRDMLSVLSVTGVEKRIGDVPGVESVTVNFAAGNATVRFDETRLNISDIKSDVRQSGYNADDVPADPAASGHEDHAAPGAPPKDGQPVPKSAPAAVATAGAAPAGSAPPEKAAANSSPSATPESADGAPASKRAMPDKS